MRIKDDCFMVEDKKLICEQLQDFLAQPSDRQARPCPGCRFTFDDNASLSSTQHCSWSCPHAAQQMSSEPEMYPIEANAVSLVYAFYTLRRMMPCWSCEGHVNAAGVLCKRPRVWFYSTAAFYPKMLAQYVSQLRGEQQLNSTWDVKILPFSQSMFSTTYCLEPDSEEAHQAGLKLLRQDMHRIARDLRTQMFALANSYLQRALQGKPNLLS